MNCFVILKINQHSNYTSKTSTFDLYLSFCIESLLVKESRKSAIYTSSKGKKNNAAKSTNTKAWRGYETSCYYGANKEKRGKPQYLPLISAGGGQHSVWHFLKRVVSKKKKRIPGGTLRVPTTDICMGEEPWFSVLVEK